MSTIGADVQLDPTSRMSDYKAQLLAVEAKLAKDPDNAELLSLKSDLIEMIELSETLDEEESLSKPASSNDTANNAGSRSGRAASSRSDDHPEQQQQFNAAGNLVKRPPSEAELLARKKEKNRKKKAKLRERLKEQLDIAESEKQSWQSFANKKGLKGVTKKSIFASPASVTGKVGVGTNGIADAPSVGATHATLSSIKRKH